MTALVSRLLPLPPRRGRRLCPADVGLGRVTRPLPRTDPASGGTQSPSGLGCGCVDCSGQWTWVGVMGVTSEQTLEERARDWPCLSSFCCDD